MQHDVRTLGVDDVEAALLIRAQAFGNPIDDEQRRVVTTRFGRGGSLGVDIGDRLAGMLTVHPLGQYFGGRSVPMGGIASVCVSVEHRGRGVAPALLTAALGEMRDRGQAVSSLHPATTGLYRRAGWELAGDYGMRQLPIRSLAGLHPGEPERLRTGGPGDLPLLIDCYSRVAPSRAGWIDRPAWFWDHAYTAPTPATHLLVCDAADGSGVSGFALYEQVPAAGLFGFSIEVAELVAVDVTAELSLWRGLASFGAQVDTVVTIGATGALLPFLLPEQDLREQEANAWMLRLVDAPGAVAARGYSAGVTARVDLEIRDPLAPWNDGAFVLTVADGEGELTAGGTGGVQLPISALSALYAGYASAEDLAAVGTVHGPFDDLRTLDAVFAGPRPAMLEFF